MEEVPVAKADIAALLAVGAALFIAIGDVIHQRAAHEVTDEPVGNIGLFTRLLRDGQWWLGSVVAAVGFALQAAALGLGSVLLVQALLVTSLLFALPISAWRSHRKLTRWEWTWAVLLAASVAVIVTVGNPTAGHSRASLDAWTGVILVMGPVLVLSIIGARVWSGPTRAVLLALVSGSLWGLFAVLTKGVVDRRIWQLVRTPELYAWALVAIAGTAWQQSSFRAGSMTASLPTMTVAEPVVGSSLGIVVLGEDTAPGRCGLVHADRGRRGDGGRDSGAGPRRGDHHSDATPAVRRAAGNQHQALILLAC
jgi:drug/metabolite transporter (DMT)-like permease